MVNRCKECKFPKGFILLSRNWEQKEKLKSYAKNNNNNNNTHTQKKVQ